MIDRDHKLPIKRQAIVLESRDDYGRSLLYRSRGGGDGEVWQA
jgi:hypothetical protein